MQEKKSKDDAQNLKQQPALGKKQTRAKATLSKNQDTREVAERGVEAQKRETLGGKTQKSAVARGKSATETKAPEAQQSHPNHDKDASQDAQGVAANTANPRPSGAPPLERGLGEASTKAVASPDVGQSAPQHAEEATNTVEESAAGAAIGRPSEEGAPPAIATDAVEVTSVGSTSGRPSEEDVHSKDAAETTTPPFGHPSREGNLDTAHAEGEAVGSVIGHPSHDAKDASTGSAIGGPSHDAGKGDKSEGKAPAMGGAVAIPAPKQPNLGDGAVGRWAAPGMTGRLKAFSKLGEGLSTDAGQAFDDSDAKLPDEGKAEEKVDNSAAQKARAGEGAAAVMIAAQNRQSPELKVPQQSAVKMAGSDDALGAKPPVEADLSAIEAAAQSADSETVAAQMDGATAHADIDRTLETRGLTDVVAETIDIEKPEYKASGDIDAQDLDLVEGEAAEILDASEFAEQNVDSLKAAQESEKQAYEAHANSVDDSVTQYDTGAAAARDKAHADEETEIDQHGQALNSQLDSEKASFDSEIEGKAAEAKADTDAARAEIDAEKAQTQSKVDAEYDAAKQEESAAAKEGENKKKSLLERAADALKQVGDWLKSKVKAIFDKARQLIDKLVEGFINFVAKINKDLADKLRALYDALKSLVSKLVEALKQIVEAIIDAIKAALEAIAQWLIQAIQALIDGLKAVLKAIQAALLAALDALEALAKAIMESALGDILKKIFEAACQFAGIDSSVFATAFGALRDIIENPGRFFSTLGKGFVQGFKNFAANIKENIKAIFTNLFNLWLGTNGLTMPESFSLGSLIKLGLQVIGVNIDGILGKLGVDLDNLGQIDPEAPIPKFIRDVKQNGIGAIVNYLGDYLKDFAQEVMNEAIQTIVQKAATAAIAKLAMLTNPVSGIVAALKAVWDLVQFVRENMSAISGLAGAVVNLMAGAAKGDSSGVATAVEATLCQVIPLVIDLLLRLAGINVGGAVKGLLTKIRTKVQAAIDKVIGKLQQTKVGQAYTKGKAAIDDTKAAVKGAVVGAAGNLADGAIGAVSAKVDPMIQGGVDKFGQTGVGQTLGGVNANAQGFADRTSAWTNSQRAAQADKAKGQVWDSKGIVGALNGDKIGNLGVNLDNVAMLKEREEERKAKAEEKRAEREAEVKVEEEVKVEVETQTEQTVEPKVEEVKVEPEAESKIEQEPKVEQEEQFVEKSSNEVESERDPEQERYEAYWRAKEGPEGDLPPDMTREDYDKWQLASSKVDKQMALDKVDGDALLALRTEERESETVVDVEQVAESETEPKIEATAESKAKHELEVKQEVVPETVAMGGTNLTKSQSKSIRSFELLIAEHIEKLEAYKAEPWKYDNEGRLKGAPNDVVRQEIIQNRIVKLEKEIQKFRDNIQKIQRGKL